MELGNSTVPLHFSTLDLDAMRQQVPDVKAGFGPKLKSKPVSSFRIKSKASCVKTYSIRRGIEYKVLESNHAKWLIRITLWQWKGIWEHYKKK
ncbi:hypothetical protein Ahy_B03g062980 [Arachis hypogaea]|uniref:Uncharacterized protein n=1 Tax=Arachis hypogaea TaxID=3818 RepID=A0A444ZWA4_ARAHY|nr:hypothetical protein Ahy_B03g062980 [Arachis hypogaea]